MIHIMDEAQKPKKPFNERIPDYDSERFFCPTCGKDITANPQPVCPGCGQRIDWEVRKTP